MPIKLLHGAGHESGLRPGTENIILIRGMTAALETAVQTQPSNSARYAHLRQLLLMHLANELSVKQMVPLVNGGDLLDNKLPNTLNVALFHPQTNTFASAYRLMDETSHLVCMSAGSACHSVIDTADTDNNEHVKPVTSSVISMEELAKHFPVSTSLQAVGVTLPRAMGTLRISCGRTTTEEDVIRAAKIIGRRAVQQLGDW